MATDSPPVEEPQESSRAAGACVLVVLCGGALAVLFAVSDVVGVIAVWVVGAVALWRAARRRMSVSSAPPPSGGTAPLSGERAVQELADGTTLVTREGMSIFLVDDSTSPNRTHVRVECAPAVETERTS